MFALVVLLFVFSQETWVRAIVRGLKKVFDATNRMTCRKCLVLESIEPVAGPFRKNNTQNGSSKGKRTRRRGLVQACAEVVSVESKTCCLTKFTLKRYKSKNTTCTGYLAIFTRRDPAGWSDFGRMGIC